MKKLFFLLIASSFLFSSCDKWFDGQVVTLDIPDHTPQLVAYSYLTAGDDFAEIRIGKSVGILSEDNPEIIDNATIKLFKNDVLLKEFSSSAQLSVDTLWISPDSSQVYVDSLYRFGEYLDEPIAATPDKYEFEVSAPNFETIRATQVMPAPTEITGATFDLGGTVDDFGDRADLVTFDIKDDPNVENYYLVEVFYADEFDSTYFNSMYVFSFDPASEPGHYNPLFRDLGFNGQTYSARLSVYNWNATPPAKIKIAVASITKAYYTFSKSMLQYWNAEGNPFSQPVVLSSNFENGLGLFSTMSVTEYEFNP